MKVRIGLLFILIGLSVIVFSFGSDVYLVSAQSNTVCCSETTSGAFCQNVPADECSTGAQQVPTSCESTSFCKAGTCFDSNEGTCMDNTPELVCNDNGGIWSEERPPQCDLGCCILGDQAAFVTLVRCKKLSSFLGLQTNYDRGITDELSCVATVSNQDKGACVFDFEFERTCKFTTRDKCAGSAPGVEGEESVAQGTFFKDKLCSAEELATNCGPSRETTCLDGKDEVYFLDTCGNPANIYDASKLNDQNYWADVKSKEDSCGSDSGNALSPGCGNCNYLAGSYCRDESIVNSRATYGDFICADLNCKSTSNGQSYRHGESWCVNADHGTTGKGDNSVGSRFFKHICINGEEVVEQCADFRAEECIQDSIESFSQAACRVNRWQDCTAQIEEADCVNTDRRDCYWKEDIFFFASNGTQIGACLPKNPPGLNFWDNTETAQICSLGNAQCIVEYEKGFFGGEECVKNCDCLTKSWENERAELCSSLGDCGPGSNWVGVAGYKEGFEKKIERLKKVEDD